MSTKIYEAYVTSEVFLLQKFVKSYRERCYNHIAKTMKRYMTCVKEDYIAKRKSEIQNEDLLAYKKLDDWIRLEFVFKESWYASKCGLNDPFNFDCSLNVFVFEGSFYIIPYNPSRDFKTPKIDGVRDFCYWNNTDEPEKMNKKEWRNRGEIWDIIVDDWNRYRFTHEIFEGKDMYCRGQCIVEKKILGKGMDDAFLNACFSAVVHADEEHRNKQKNDNAEEAFGKFPDFS